MDGRSLFDVAQVTGIYREPTNTDYAEVSQIRRRKLRTPIPMCAANSAGGVIGKMVDAQSITIATAATEQVGNEGIIFRFVAWHSVALCSIVGVIVLLYGRSSRCQSTPIILVVSWETRGR